MKTLISVAVLFLAGVIGVSAQTVDSNSQTLNEGSVSYSFLRQDIHLNDIKHPSVAFNQNTDSHGAEVAYTRYFKTGNGDKNGILGVTGVLTGNFGSADEASLVTLMGGIQAKGRNFKYVQPSVRVLFGGAREHVNKANYKQFSDTSLAEGIGAGLDFNTSAYSRYKVHLGADWVHAVFNQYNQNSLRLSAGFVF